MSEIGILHVCCIDGKTVNGMEMVIPKHVKEQSKYAKTGLINLNSHVIKSDGIESISYDNIWKCRDEIAEMVKQYDIVVFHGVYHPVLIVFWRLFVNGKIPYIVFTHGSLTRGVQEKGKLKKQTYNLLCASKYLKRAKAIQFLSIEEKEDSDNRLFDNFIVQPNGVYKQEKTRKPTDVKKNGTLYITFVGRYDIYHKGLDYLLLACKNQKDFLITNSIEIHLYGMFANSDIDKVNQMIEDFCLADLVYTHDGVFGEGKEKVFLSSDYFIHTSRLEGLPMGILEAYSYGIPVLVTQNTNAGGDIEEYHNGYVEDTSVYGVERLLRDAVEGLSQYEYLCRQSLECFKKYDWSIVAEETVKKYEALINKEM